MKIKFLGTGCYEGTPAILCNCEVCKKARKLGGKNLRTRSQALIDNDMLLDMPGDTFVHFLTYGIDLLNIKHWLITHTHSDHFYPEDLPATGGGYTHHDDAWHGIDFHASIDFKADFDKHVWDETHKKYIRYNEAVAFKEFKTGEYTVLPLKANHGTDNPLFYAITKNGKSMLYAHDTGPFYDETWESLKKSGIKFDLVSMDCTAGAQMDYDYHKHMCLGWDIECRQKMYDLGLADEHTIFVLNHYSHNGLNTVYDDFKEIAEKHGFVASFDGMEIEF